MRACLNNKPIQVKLWFSLDAQKLQTLLPDPAETAAEEQVKNTADVVKLVDTLS